MLLHRLIVDLVADDAGDMTTVLEVEGEPPFVTALGMLDMARQQLYDRTDSEDMD